MKRTLVDNGVLAMMRFGSATWAGCAYGCLAMLRVSVLVLLLGPAARADDGPAGTAAPPVTVPLLAHWAFDEDSGDMIHDSAPDSARHITAQLPRSRGVHGMAAELTGAHQLPTRPIATAATLPGIAFSAWVKPADLSGYREIYRQECPERILFSFQNSGTVLSLGLNVNGYIECDASLDPSNVLDGAWHHTAATFDGQVMRVYLDGAEIAHLDRVGPITTNLEAPAFIGSSGGTGEHWQGALDDLRIYQQALSAADVRRLYQGGIESLSIRLQHLQQAASQLYHPQATFAATLVNFRRALMEQRTAPLDRELVGLLLAKLRADFARDYADFATATGNTPFEYLTAENHDALAATVGRLVELMLEYQPLTDDQRSRLTPDQQAYWAESQRIKTEFERLKQAGATADDSPEWIEIMLAAGRRVQPRPAVSEAVAPYRRPETPPLRDLTAEEADAALRRDWLHQADGHPTADRILAEIRWTEQLAQRLAQGGVAPEDIAKELAELDTLQQRAAEIVDADAELYFRVREVKRRLMFQNPAVDFDQILLVDMPFPDGSEWPHETRHRLGYMAVPGGRLLVLKGLSPDGHLRQLMPQLPLHGSFWRPDLSWDAQKVLFCFQPHNEKSFHLYEINIDGSGLRQLTDGPYDDLDPIYLPDGRHLMFSTTRGHTYVRCMPPTNAFVLARCDADGNNVYLVSQNNEPDYLPSVLDDGRVVYTRWEYTDKPLWRAQKLWTVNPDGTQVNTLWGNQSVWPDLLKDARQIPGSRRIMFTGSAHHNWFAGSVGIIDPTRGFNFPEGITKITADVEWPESGNGPVDPIESATYHASGMYGAYYSPFPLAEQDFLVSANRNGKFVLYLMDVEGNRELIFEGAHHVLHAIPVRPRIRPPVLADRVDWPTAQNQLTPKSGVIYSTNVYEGAPEVLRGRARYLRVLHIEPKTYTYWHKRPYLSTGPVVSVVQSEGVKRILGTVPIETDGSVAFNAPPGMALHFQLLDEHHRALQTMRSFTGVMPGERRGCTGCHESHSRVPEYQGHTLAKALQPLEITPPPWGDESVSYPRFVRPVLDRYCLECHSGQGEGAKVLDLTERPGFLGFDENYMLFTGNPSWGAPYQKPANPPPGFGIANMIMVEGYHTLDPAAYETPRPMTYLSYNSRLIELAASGQHYDVRVDPVSLQRLIAWVDTMCPYRGSEEVRELDDPEFQGVDWLSVRPRIKSAPTVVRPGPVD
ncbi:MAG: LamG-like jellyroll fold domain-containing protein [Pirellulaceae bacterium]